MVDHQLLVGIVLLLALVIALVVLAVPRQQQLLRAEFIRTYPLPPGLLDKLTERYPDFTRKECALVSRALRQFFVAYLMSGKQFVSMPSVAADALWHEFILYTREYQDFCRRAFGGFLHHSPAAALSLANKESNEGLRRVWWYSCKYENIDAANPTRLPLLFALDAKLQLPNGSVYRFDSEALRDLTSSARQGKSRFGDSGTVHCGGGGGVGHGGGGHGGDGGGSCGGGGCGGGSS